MSLSEQDVAVMNVLAALSGQPGSSMVRCEGRGASDGKAGILCTAFARDPASGQFKALASGYVATFDDVGGPQSLDAQGERVRVLVQPPRDLHLLLTHRR